MWWWGGCVGAVERVESSRAIDRKVESIIDQTWRAAADDQKSGKINLFDGPMCRLESFSAKTDRLQLRVSDTSYRIFYGTNLMHPELADKFGVSVLARPL